MARQKFVIELEWLAGDKGYTAEELKELLKAVFGSDYDNEIYSVKEITK